MALTLSKKASEVKPSSTLAITAKAKALKAQGVDLVGFGAGEPDFNTPDNINDVACEAIRNGFTKYTPASGIEDLKKAVSEKFKTFNKVDYGVDQIVISNGGKHSLTNIFTAIINEGDEVVIPAPFWLSYPEIVKLAGGVPVIVTTTPENDFKITAQQLAEACTDKTKAFVLNSPNNPTGMIYTREELEALAKVIVEKDIYVVADEMYEYLIRVASQPKKHVLTDVLLETLSIIAYKQPVTKLEIEKIRGVKSDHAVNKLVEYNLVSERGRMDAPGKPILFGTTEEFLRRFSIHSLDDLPSPNPEQVETFKEEAEEEVQLKLDI